MRFILVFQVVLTAIGAVTAQALAADPSPRGVTFSILLEGQNIGRHTVAFERQGGDQIVSINVDITAQKLGVVAYRFQHKAREVWKDGQLESLNTSTDDNGRQYTVEARQTAHGFEVKRSAPPAMSPAEIANGGIAAPEISRETLPKDTLPTSLWNVDTVKRSALLHTEFGTLAKVQIEPIGQETVSVGNRNLQAMRYHFTGDLRMDLWFDDEGHWVKASFAAPAGLTVDYVLDE
jgi:hypothetical protein